MKKKIMLLLLTILVIITRDVIADPPGVGFGTNNPVGAFVHIANPPAANIPSLRLDSIPNISLSNLQYFLVVDTGGKIVGKISADKDTLRKVLDINDKPNIFVIDNLCSNSYTPGNNCYSNSNKNQYIVSVGNLCCFYSEIYGLQKCNFDTIFGFPGIINPTASGVAIIDDYVYICLKGSNVDTLKVFRIPVNNFKNSTSQRIYTSGIPLGNTNTSIMTANGDFLYFSNNGGNTGSESIIAKYKITGSILSRISTITLSGLIGSVNNFFVKNNGNILVMETSSGKVKSFTNVGVFNSEIANLFMYQVFNWNNTIYISSYSGGIGLLRKFNIFD